MSRAITAPVALKKFQTPKFAVIEADGDGRGIPIAELPDETLDERVSAWLTEVYTTAGKSTPWTRGEGRL